MILFGMPMGFGAFTQQQQYLPAAGAAHTTDNPTSSAPNAGVPAPAATTGAMTGPKMAPMTMMTPAYMMAYPQMSQMGQMSGAGYAGGAAAAGAAGSGHVTANPTNATVQQDVGAAGFGGYGGTGMYGGFAMPVMMMAPVFFQLGYPMVFQGSQAQPPVTDAGTVAADAPAVDAPAAEVVDVPDPVAQAPVNTDPVVIDVVPETDAADAPTVPPIVQLDNGDFAKYRSIEKSARQETSLSLELTTKDGDTITLDFSQIDSFDMSRFRGRTADGDKVTDQSYNEGMERVVNMDVLGNLSDEEKAAVDSVLQSVMQAVDSFFRGDVGQAVQKLKAMDFDGGQLAELSLNMSMSKSAEVSKAFFNGADAMQDLMDRDANLSQALEFIASEQKRLIDLAKDVLDAPSAVGLVRSLMPPLMSDPFAELAEQVAEGGVALDSEAGDQADDEDDD